MVNCLICGRKLTDPDSVKRGIGPVCWSKIEREDRRERQVKSIWSKACNPDLNPEGLDLIELAHRIEEHKPSCICGATLRGYNIDHYGPHDGGEIVRGYGDPRWVYVHCDRCGYDMAIHKIKREIGGAYNE